MNFLEHTLDVLSDNGKTIEDIDWIGTPHLELSWDEFSQMAEGEENLDAGNAGLISLPDDLKIVGDNWWLDLEAIPSIEDDDQIEWQYREKPPRPLNIDQKTREHIHNRIMNSEISDFSIVFGDIKEEYSDVIFIDTQESYFESRID